MKVQGLILAACATLQEGGPGSGHYGHRGIPGQKGGSLPGSGGGQGAVAWGAGNQAASAAVVNIGPTWERLAKGGGQEAVLGVVNEAIAGQDIEYAAVVSAEGKVLLVKAGGAKTVDFTDAEVRLFKGAVLTHNHPTGRSFSPADVQLACDGGMARIEAVSRQGGEIMRYSMAIPMDMTYARWTTVWRPRLETQIREQYAEGLAKIRAGAVSAEQLNRTYWHDVWDTFARTAKAAGEDFQYQREVQGAAG